MFYINLPIGLFAFTGVFLFIREQRLDAIRPFDLFGFATLAVAIGAFQLFLDRGQTQDWFDFRRSPDRICGDVARSVFIPGADGPPPRRPFVDVAIFADSNFVTASVFGFFIGVLLFSSLALLPPFMETLLGYSVVTTGLVSMPRGVGTLAAMVLVGRLMGRIDVRIIPVDWALPVGLRRLANDPFLAADGQHADHRFGPWCKGLEPA